MPPKKKTKTSGSQEKTTLFTWSEQELELLFNVIQHYIVMSDFVKKGRISSQSSVKVSFDNLKYSIHSSNMTTLSRKFCHHLPVFPGLVQNRFGCISSSSSSPLSEGSSRKPKQENSSIQLVFFYDVHSLIMLETHSKLHPGSMCLLRD